MKKYTLLLLFLCLPIITGGERFLYIQPSLTTSIEDPNEHSCNFVVNENKTLLICTCCPEKSKRLVTAQALNAALKDFALNDEDHKQYGSKKTLKAKQDTVQKLLSLTEELKILHSINPKTAWEIATKGAYGFRTRIVNGEIQRYTHTISINLYNPEDPISHLIQGRIKEIEYTVLNKNNS